MTLKPHSRAWYAQLAAQTGVYDYSWTQVLSAPSGETLFDTLLEELLTPEARVLEAGCGHGLDAQRYAGRVQSYTGYDFIPDYVTRARENVPEAEFVLWDSSREPVPEGFKGRFDLVTSRRGPTSVVLHLLELCAPGARPLRLSRRRNRRGACRGTSVGCRSGTGRAVAGSGKRFSADAGRLRTVSAVSWRRANPGGAWR